MKTWKCAQTWSSGPGAFHEVGAMLAASTESWSGQIPVAREQHEGTLEIDDLKSLGKPWQTKLQKSKLCHFGMDIRTLILMAAVVRCSKPLFKSIMEIVPANTCAVPAPSQPLFTRGVYHKVCLRQLARGSRCVMFQVFACAAQAPCNFCINSTED